MWLPICDFFIIRKDEISLLRIINVPRRGIGETSVVKIVEAAREKNLPVMKMLDSPNLAALVGDGPALRLLQFRQLVHDYTKRFRQPGMSYTLEKLISDLGYEQDLKKSSKSEKDFIRRWENVMEVTNSLAGYSEEEKKPTLRGFLERVSLLTGEEKGDKKQPDEGVTLMTVHSAKGLEFPLVYLVGMEEDLFPHAKSMADGGDALHEERRLCYVALTRAQKHLVLSRAEKRRKFGKMQKRIPSRFLKEIPEDLVQPLAPRF